MQTYIGLEKVSLVGYGSWFIYLCIIPGLAGGVIA